MAISSFRLVIPELFFLGILSPVKTNWQKNIIKLICKTCSILLTYKSELMYVLFGIV